MKWPWQKEERAEEPISNIDNVLLQALLGGSTISKKEALNIPSIKSCINFIADTVSMIPIKLYQAKDGKADEITDDNRVKLLNDDTKDTLDAVQFWRALIADYFLGKGGYAYIKKYRNQVASLHYVEEEFISIQENTDPIFKDYHILVNGKNYLPFDFLKILRNSKDGAEGISIIEENNLLISVAYNSLIFEENLVKKGGNKKGFIKSQRRLSEEAITALKNAWKKLYSNNSDNVVVLNDGLDFQESSNTSVEMQLNENKKSNADEICKIFNIPVNIINGTASSKEYTNAFKMAIMPVLRVIECALNRELLLEKEKGSFYYAFDTKEMLKGDLKERFEAYKVAIESNFMGIDEIRFMEDLPALGIEWIKLGLDSVLYDPKTKEIYTPNTNQSQNIGNLKGGENIEDRDPE
ncbi:phage portal protein [Tissierella creatinophila]|uniref:Phage portal protein n=1 Tax=Tissierella creatinophila DSM 6911 TaxID=1123403 RepID=A0A1U7M531_TISCR|nr:phage portal protein [Tissierella creatinophila]OLS02417.1 phage portal protein [Tissierella creatinophila DSM 6911]